MKKIAIIGAGLVGRLLALKLNKHYCSQDEVIDLHLFERGEKDQNLSVAYIAAAMVSPTAESVVASENIVNLGHQSLDLWPQYLNELNLSVYFQQEGSLVLAHPQDQSSLNNFIQRLKLNDSNKQGLSAVTRSKISELEPELANKFSSGFYIEGEGQVDNQAFFSESLRELENANIKLHFEKQVNLASDSSDTGMLMYSDSAELPQEKVNQALQSAHFDYIFDCRGLGAKNELKANKCHLRGVRGEVVRLYAPEVTINRPIRLMHPRYPIYVVPKPNNEFVIGATEIESEDNKPVTVRSALELLSAAYSLHSGFAEAEILFIKSGLRPTLQDNEPVISEEGRLMQINGLYRHGYLLSPALVEQALTRFFCSEVFSKTNTPESNQQGTDCYSNAELVS